MCVCMYVYIYVVSNYICGGGGVCLYICLHLYVCLYKCIFGHTFMFPLLLLEECPLTPALGDFCT